MCTDRLTEMPHGSADPPDFLPFLTTFSGLNAAWLKRRRPLYVRSSLSQSSNLNIFSIMVSGDCVLFSA